MADPNSLVRYIYGPDAMPEAQFRLHFDHFVGDQEDLDHFWSDPTPEEKRATARLIWMNPNHMRTVKKEWDEVFGELMEKAVEITVNQILRDADK